MMRFFLALVGLVVGASGSLCAGGIVNGSFESPGAPSGGYVRFEGGSSEGSSGLPGWKVNGTDVVAVNSFMQNGITFQAQNGNSFLDLTGVTSNFSGNGITRDVTTSIGSTYRLTFWVGSTTDDTPTYSASTVALSFDLGITRILFPNPTADRHDLNWEQFTYSFVATGSATSIGFFNGNGVNSNNNICALDNVSLVEMATVGAPAPSTMVLSLIGLGTLFVYRSRSYFLNVLSFNGSSA